MKQSRSLRKLASTIKGEKVEARRTEKERKTLNESEKNSDAY